ncbi:MAG: hypothetical protein ACRDXC_03685 [Acidimicrobiales bacterium]
MSEPCVAVFSSSWTEAPRSELAAAVRSIAGALTRLAEVDVFVPGTGQPFGDGAFDVTPISERDPPRRSYTAAVVEPYPGGAAAMARPVASPAPGTPVFAVGAAPTPVDGILDVGLDCVDAGGGGARCRSGVDPEVHRVGLYARVHPGARSRRHYGLGDVPEYLLVLGDRQIVPAQCSPTDRVRWLLARFARRHVVVLEGGVARAWRSRSCVAEFDVHTRMDLWILMAQAWAVVDLLPGDLYARECVEALRLGVPVVVPDGGAAARLARAGGGLRFASTADLLACVDALFDPAARASLGAAGRQATDRWYGDPHAFVARLGGALGLPTRRAS